VHKNHLFSFLILVIRQAVPAQIKKAEIIRFLNTYQFKIAQKYIKKNGGILSSVINRALKYTSG